MTVCEILDLCAQGDLCITGEGHLRDPYANGSYLQYRPYSDADTIDLFESEIHFYSDSALKLVNTAGAKSEGFWS